MLPTAAPKRFGPRSPTIRIATGSSSRYNTASFRTFQLRGNEVFSISFGRASEHLPNSFLSRVSFDSGDRQIDSNWVAATPMHDDMADFAGVEN